MGIRFLCLRDDSRVLARVSLLDWARPRRTRTEVVESRRWDWVRMESTKKRILGLLGFLQRLEKSARRFAVRSG